MVTVTTCTINHMEQKTDTETDGRLVVKKYPFCMELELPLPHTHTHTHNGSFIITTVGQVILIYNSDFQTVVLIPPVICGRSPGGM
jgi:hypothetical protein